MSLAAAAKLNPPVRDLVVAFTENGTRHVGDAEKDQQEVAEWIEKAAQPDVASAASIQSLNTALIPRTYLVNNTLSAADVAIYGALHPYFVRPSAVPTRPSLTAPVTSPSSSRHNTTRASAAPSTSASAQKPQKTEKKEKEKKDASAEQQSVMKHPDADSLYVEQIDFAEETGPRTVVSGLVVYIPIEQMRDKLLVGVCNLKSANMRGVKSFAMVLCATSKEGKEGGVELVRPPEGAKPGDRVYFEGADFESQSFTQYQRLMFMRLFLAFTTDAQPLAQLNPKKKIFKTIQPGFTTLETREAAWVNPATKSVHKIRTKDGFCIAPTFVGASLS
ncbi:hypothetical protein C0993_000857 [Termitomyces sp. T159_Od127]|nr:hypothetical protein C0993_000857 [Termitomyces sp. T159_Od127]